MIKAAAAVIPTPSIEELFFQTGKHGGISLFRSASGADGEITGLNPVITLTERELFLGKQRFPVEDPLTKLDELLGAHSYLPEEVCFLGYITYDYKDRLEEEGLYRRISQGIFPDLYFVLFEHYLITERNRSESKHITLGFPFLYEHLTYTPGGPPEEAASAQDRTFYRGTSLDRRRFKGAVEKTLGYIRGGDIYQANITRAIYGETTFTPLQTALRLYGSNRITQGVFASLPGGHVVGTSPELFFCIRNGCITASPIKGTAPRDPEEQRDRANGERLFASEKNRAELAMIVDLLRNDLSRVCLPGTVEVPKFPRLMSLKNVHHLFADVTGELIPGTGAGEVIKKIFPGGSVTGCPKIRACQIIDELEGCPRGMYTGSFGRLSFSGQGEFNIMIRSLFQVGARIIFNVGGGITLLSDPEGEYEETIHKGSSIWKAMKMENIREEWCYTGESSWTTG